MKILRLAIPISMLALTIMGNVQGANRETFDSFKVLRNRNIFDPNRVPGRSNGSSRDVNDAEVFSLTGILVQGGKSFAFFSSPKSSKVVPLQGQINGCKVSTISSSKVDLERNDQKISIAVGKQFRAPEAGPMEIVDSPDGASSGFSASSNPESPTSISTESNSSPAAGNDLIRQMMEKRKRELSK